MRTSPYLTMQHDDSRARHPRQIRPSGGVATGASRPAMSRVRPEGEMQGTHARFGVR